MMQPPRQIRAIAPRSMPQPYWADAAAICWGTCDNTCKTSCTNTCAVTGIEVA